MADWTNWAGTAHAGGIEILRPDSVADLAEQVAAAAASGCRIKPCGSGHSFTAVAQPVDLQLDLSALSGVLRHDPDSGRAWIAAGTRLSALGPALGALGLALPNMGDIDAQTLAGAISTGTHGTGAGFTGFAGLVTSVELVAADGAVLVIGPDDARLAGVPIGLGALGVVTAYEVQCVPTFLLQAREAPAALDDVLASLDERVDGADHFEFYWFPHTDRALTKTNTRITDLAERDPLPRWRRRLDDEFLSNTVFEGVNRVATRFRGAVPRMNQVAGRALSERTYTDTSYGVFATPRRVRFRESEFCVPRTDVPAVLHELRGYFASRAELVSFPIEVRFAAPDDRWLSTAYGRESGYIAVHQYHRIDYRPYFEAFWDIVTAVSGDAARPHWGKLHNLDATALRARYPKFDEFAALRGALDPTGLFVNRYLERVLGVSAS